MTSDRDAVERVVANYYEAWFTGDAELMRESLHPNLAKRAINDGGGGSLDLDVVTADEMVALTAGGAGTKYARGHQTQLLDIDGAMATVKVVSSPYIEYLHIGRFGSRWLIVNILWRYRANGAAAR